MVGVGVELVVADPDDDGPELVGLAVGGVSSALGVNRATLYLAERDVRMAELSIVSVPGHPWPMWCWAPDSLLGAPRLLSTTLAQWRVDVLDVLERVRSQTDG